MTKRIFSLALNKKWIMFKINGEYFKLSSFIACNFINQAILLSEFHVY